MLSAKAALFDLDATYRMEADVMICRHCGRTQQVSWHTHDFQHRTDCHGAGAWAPQRPWGLLAEALSAAATLHPAQS